MIKNYNLNFSLPNFCELLIILYPIFLLLSPGLADILSLTIILNFILNYKKFNFKIDIFQDKTLIILFVFSLYLILNYFLSINKELSFSRCFYFIRFPLLVISLQYLYLNNFFSLNKIISYYLIIIFVVILDTYLQFFTGKNILGYEAFQLGKIKRLSSFLENEYKIAGYLVPFTSIIIGFLFSIKNLNMVSKVSFLLLVFNAVFFTGERSNLYIFYLIIFSFILFSNLKIKIKSLLIFLIIVNTFLINIFNKDLSNRAFELTKKIITDDRELLIVEEKSENQEKKPSEYHVFYLYQYSAHYLTAYKIFLDHPITGSGMKTFREACKNEKYKSNLPHDPWRCSSHPHNVVLEILSELGIAGFIILIIFFILVLYKFIKIYIDIKSNFLFSLILVFIFIYFPLVPRGSFFTNFNANIFWIITGIMYTFNYSTTKILKK